MDAGRGRARFLPLVIVVVGALLFSATSLVAHVPRANALANCTADSSLDAEEQAFLGLINAYRAQNGLGALTASTNLNRAAAWLAVDLGAKNYFSHTDSLGRSPSQRVMDCGYPQGAGENIAAGTVASSAQQAFSMWKASSGHNANMLNGSYRQIGIGRAYTGGSTYGWYWVTDFGSTDDGTGGGGPVPPANTPTPVPTTPPPTATPTRTATPTPTQPTVVPTGQPTVAPTDTPRPSVTIPPATSSPASTAPAATPSPVVTPTSTTAPKQSPAATPTLAATATPTATRPPAHTLPLSPGANLVSWPSGDVPPSEVLGTSANTISVIYAWDPANQAWRRYGPGLPAFLNNLTVLHQGQAYWVIAKGSGGFPIGR